MFQMQNGSEPDSGRKSSKVDEGRPLEDAVSTASSNIKKRLMETDDSEKVGIHQF